MDSYVASNIEWCELESQQGKLLFRIRIEFPIDLCMRNKKEFAIVLSIAVEMNHFMKKSSNL